nr:MAG TPA: hypothetical protein [Caudoviricetes sp.]
MWSNPPRVRIPPLPFYFLFCLVARTLSIQRHFSINSLKNAFFSIQINDDLKAYRLLSEKQMAVKWQ